MDGYDSPRVQYASPRRQLSRSGKKNTIARDLDTRTPRRPPPAATQPAAKDAALVSTASRDAAAGLARPTLTITRGAILHKEAAVAAALRLARYLAKPISSENGR